MKLSELRKIAEARTKGEWENLPDGSGHPYLCSEDEHIGDMSYFSDSEFIATMSNHIDRLLDVVEQAKLHAEEWHCHLEAQSRLKEALEALEK